MKKLIFVLMILAGYGNIKALNAFELKDFQWESGGSVRIPLNSFACQTVVRTNGEKYLWGTGVSGSIKSRKIPVDFKCGDLSLSGAVSLLNNPVLSSVISPFSLPQEKVSVLSSRIPDGTSWNKPLCGFLKISGVSAFFTEEGRAGISAMYKGDFGKKEKQKLEFLGAAVTELGKARKIDSWYSENPFLKEDFRTSALIFQGAVNNRNMSFLISDFLYCQPDGKLFQVVRSENRMKSGSLSFFINPNHNLFTSSGKTINEFYQAKINFQGKSETGEKIPFFWKYGFTLLGNLVPEDQELDIKAVAGSRVLCFITSLNINVSADLVFPWDEKSLSVPEIKKLGITVKNGWYFSLIQPLFRAGFSFVPKADKKGYETTENLGLSFNVSSKPSLYLNLSSEMKQKNGGWQGGNLDAGISSRFHNRYFDVSGKVSWSIEF